MPTFRGLDFLIELPDGFRDESTYAFAIPGRGKFQPSVVVKTERLAAPQPLPAYVNTQIEKLRKLFSDWARVQSESTRHGPLPAHVLVYDWGPASQRVRQKQLYLLLDDPLRVVTLTGTHLTELFPQAEPLIDSIFRSYAPLAPAKAAARA
jgi:hypothetical protein